MTCFAQNALAGGPVVDAATRLSGLFLRLNDAPPGIREMEVHSPYIMGERFESPSTGIEAFGGVVDEDGPRAYGLSFLGGFSNELFEGAPHDLVVSSESACWNSERSETVSSDHFIYLTSGPVINRIRAALASIRPMSRRPRKS